MQIADIALKANNVYDMATNNTLEIKKGSKEYFLNKD